MRQDVERESLRRQHVGALLLAHRPDAKQEITDVVQPVGEGADEQDRQERSEKPRGPGCAPERAAEPLERRGEQARHAGHECRRRE